MAMSSTSDLWPLFLMCQVLGILPCNHQFKLSRTLLAFGFLATGVFNTLVFAIQIYSLFPKWEAWDLVRIVLQAVTRLLRFIIILSHFYVLLRRRRLHAKILNTLSVTALSGVKLYYHNILTCLVVTTISIAYSLLVFSNPSSIYLNITSCIQFLQIIGILLLFCSYVELASAEIVRNTASLRDQGFRVNWIVDKHLSQLQHLRSCNKFFDIQIFVTHAFLTYYFVYSCFTIITHLENKHYIRLGAYVFFHISCLLLIILINRACQNSSTEAEKFNSELFRLMRENKELCKNEKLQLYVTMKQTVNFTACGFFTLGYPLVTSIIAAATTYLVILVQFSMPPSKSS